MASSEVGLVERENAMSMNKNEHQPRQHLLLPDSPLVLGRVVVVAVGLRVEQLPPLGEVRVVGPQDGHVARLIPATLATVGRVLVSEVGCKSLPT